MLNTIREAFIEAATIAVPVVTSPGVVARWQEPSRIAGMTVGALACHLVRGAFTVLPPFLDDPAPPGTRAFDASRFYAVQTSDFDAEVHRGIREQAEEEAN